MKIAIVTETFLPSVDGVVTRLVHAVDYFLDKGHEVLILAPEVEGIKDSYRSAKIIGLKSKVFPFYIDRPWAIPSFKLEKHLIDFDPDIIHVVNPVLLGACGVHYAKKLNIPLVISFHTNLPACLDHFNLEVLKPLCWFFLKTTHNKSHINLVTSKAMYDLLDKHGIKGLRVLPKAVDTNILGPKNYNEEMRYKLTRGNTKDKLLLYVGRLSPEKEIEKIKPILDRNPSYSLAIVGDGPYRKDLEKIFKDNKVVFTGFLKGKSLAEAYASSDIFIFPSTAETLGLVITEAMASATPVVAAESQPSLEQIQPGKTGMIFDPNSIYSLDHAIKSLDNKSIRKSIEQQALSYAQNFSWDQSSQVMLDAYYDTLNFYNRAPVYDYQVKVLYK